MFDIFDMNHWSWVIVGLALLVLELMVPFMFFLWLGVSALVTGLCLYFVPQMGWEAQFLLFSALSIVSMVLTKKYFRRKPIETELPNLNRRAEQYVGRVFTLNEAISNGYGKISVDDSHWRVQGPELEAGTQVRVIAAKGSVFEVEPAGGQ